jgi:hypothetical protein
MNIETDIGYVLDAASRHRGILRKDGETDAELRKRILLMLLERVYEQAIKFDRLPLALIAVCALCGERTESFSLHRMDPPVRHKPGCVLFGWEPQLSDTKGEAK